MKRLLQNRTVKFKIMVYNICIICVIGIIFSVTNYMTANKKTIQLAQNSVGYHVESISRYYEEIYEQMVNLVLNCAEREMFDLSSLGQLNSEKGWIMQSWPPISVPLQDMGITLPGCPYLMTVMFTFQPERP